ncbi:Poly A polymerase head domain [Trypanosoma vivax]|nr:putative tRNA nucleotidyltransferase [Trypanosoma vivax]KAH8604180.1 Poly A polymerase head domain [Trypanosoma vivax]
MFLPKCVKLNKPVADAHQKIFDFLLRVNEERNVHAILRVAGGWVRDTLLGLHSQDIDIAIESPTARHVSGEFFAREIAAHQESLGMASRSVSVIRVNPELSKHIETATICVYDTPIELCALRHDEYTQANSRIPVVRPATPLEDALRRDYTVNALFYNLHTQEVEDYTTGLVDLERRVLRCPLEPRETFCDDPLRLLRGIRFVGQLGMLGFSLDESVLLSVDGDLLEKIIAKVSRERIGKEVIKMLSGPLSEKCVEVLYQLCILQRVLLVELHIKVSKKGQPSAEVDRKEFLLPDGVENDSNIELMLMLNRTVAPLLSRDGTFMQLQPNSSEKIVATMFLISLPFYRASPRSEIAHRLYALCVNGLKLPLALYNIVRRMVECYITLAQEKLDVHTITKDMVPPAAKLALFNALNDINDKNIGQFAFKLVFTAFVLIEHRRDLLVSGDVEGCMSVVSELLSVLEREPGLLDAASRPLPLKGNELASMVPLKPQQIGPALTALRRHAMLHPEATREDMLTWLRKEYVP